MLYNDCQFGLGKLTFRTKAGAQTYLKITFYLSTAKKHGVNAFEALALALKGETEKV